MDGGEAGVPRMWEIEHVRVALLMMAVFVAALHNAAYSAALWLA